MVLTEDPSKIIEILQEFQKLMEVVVQLSNTISNEGNQQNSIDQGTALLEGSLSGKMKKKNCNEI